MITLNVDNIIKYKCRDSHNSRGKTTQSYLPPEVPITLARICDKWNKAYLLISLTNKKIKN